MRCLARRDEEKQVSEEKQSSKDLHCVRSHGTECHGRNEEEVIDERG